jgi:Fur family peroxide stress response transcriptional regulator
MAESKRKLQSFYDTCKVHGLKITPQRTAIYEILIESDQHPSAELTYEKIHKKFPNISFDTVNRTLRTFAEIGLTSIVEGHGSPRRYDSNLDNHHHIHCIKCREIFDFHSEDLDSMEIPAEIKREYKVLNKRVVINAVCKRCRRRSSLKSRDRRKRSKR